jgi:hypothetical protein
LPSDLHFDRLGGGTIFGRIWRLGGSLRGWHPAVITMTGEADGFTAVALDTAMNEINPQVFAT